MNPNNIFGRQQGAFQAPSNASQSSGLFQSLSQQGTGGMMPNIGFGQKSPFGQPSAFSQPSAFAQGSVQASVFGPTSSFGQSPSFGQGGGLGQSSSFSSTSQGPAFGQQAVGQAPLVFGAPPPPSIGQSQPPAFGQPTGFSPSTGFGQTTSGFGISSTNAQLPSNSISTGSQANFVQPSFGQPSAFATTSSAVSGQNNPQPSAFGTKFSFKPTNETVFKPIFSVSPVPPSVQPVLAPEPFGSSVPVTGGTDSSGTGRSGVSLFTSVKPNTQDFSFSQPGAVPSASVTSASTFQAAGGMISGNTPQFTFSQPANPSSSSSITTAQSTSISSNPSAFSFSAKVIQPQIAFGQPSFVFDGSKPEESQEVRNEEISGEGPFGSLGKGMKRKEETSDPNARQGKISIVEEAQSESEGPRHPSKRALVRSRGATSGLFINALSGLMKASVSTAKKEERTIDRAPGERPDPPVLDVDATVNPPRSQAPIRHVLEKAETPGEFKHLFFIWIFCVYSRFALYFYYLRLRCELNPCNVCTMLPYLK